MSRRNTAKKNNLLLQKRKLEEQLKLCENQIEEAKHSQTNTNREYDESSDSDSDLTIQLDKGPSLIDLKTLHSTLETCLNATQELTGLQVLESEVNVLVDDPVLEREPPVTEAGLWREVTVECRVDLVTFTISFFVHRPYRRFGPLSYRSLQVGASKPAHEKELSRSILADVTRPGEAFEVMKSYAAAGRSRRSTLARLAEKYGDGLFMMPMADGGYKLKCANLLEISWVLQNKSSSIAPFKHQMTFDLEYKDESLLKTITQANKQLCNPSIATEDRTSLLSAIISACLDSQGFTQQSSTDTESETARPQNRSNAYEPEAPDARKRKDAEVMAPPKLPPKKFKSKSKHHRQAEAGTADAVHQKPVGDAARGDSEDKMADEHSNKQAAAKANNKLDRGKKVTSVVENGGKKKIISKSVANVKKVYNEKNKDKENIHTAKDKIKNNNNTVGNTDKSKSNVPGNTDSNKAKLLHVRGLADGRSVRNGSGKAGSVHLQKTKIPQSVNLELMKNPKRIMRISPKKTVDRSASQNNVRSANGSGNKARGNIPGSLKKPPSKTK